MDLSHITSQSLRRVLNLTERKDQLVALIAEIETEISRALSGAVAPAAKAPDKKAAPARKARKRSSSRKAKSGGLKEKILAVLASAGSGGLKVKDIAAKVGSPAPNVSVWFSTTGKKLTQKLEPGRYAIKGAKPAPAPAAPAPAPAAPVKAKVVVKARKKGKKPSPLKGRILTLLDAAGPKGLRVKDIAAKLGLPGGNISVWISTTGKTLVSKVEPGVYAVKGSKPAVALAAKPAPASPAKKAPAKKAAKAAKKPAAPAKKAFKLSKPKGKNK
jgi:hypothetical protein